MNFRASSWEDIHAALKDNGITNILHSLVLVYSLPATSVLNESGFNQLKLIKTDKRHSLNKQHLNDLMLTTSFRIWPKYSNWQMASRFKNGLNETKIGKKLIRSFFYSYLNLCSRYHQGGNREDLTIKELQKVVHVQLQMWMM